MRAVPTFLVVASLSGCSDGDPVKVPTATEGGPPEDRSRETLPRAGISRDPLPPQGPVPKPPAARLRLLPLSCCSELRGRTQVDAIVIHTTERPDEPAYEDLDSLWRLFIRVHRSSHVANDAEGHSTRMVDDGRFAFHATYWNVSTLGLEQMGSASFTREEWLARPSQIDNTARWIAHWAGLYRIPIRRCQVTVLRYNRNRRVIAGEIVRRGVCSHRQLDPLNRGDPGEGYPWERVLSRARAIVAATRAQEGTAPP